MHTDGKIGKTHAFSSRTSLHLIPKNQRQPYYISANTWNLLQARQTALTQEQFNHAKDLSSKIKKAVREDKEKQLKEQRKWREILTNGMVSKDSELDPD